MEMQNIMQVMAPFGPFALEKNRQLSAKNCLVGDITIDNTSATDFYVQLWDVAQASDIGGAAAVADAAPDFEEVVPAGSFVPFGWPGGYQFHRGLYVRCVTALGGSTAIPANSAKFSGRMISPYPICS